MKFVNIHESTAEISDEKDPKLTSSNREVRERIYFNSFS